MKKNLFILSALGLSAASSLMLSACRDYDVMDEEYAKEVALEAARVKEFNQHFIERFGEPDPEHTWGTDKKLAPMFPNVTRAAGTVEVNRNQWCEIQSTSGSGSSLSITYKDFALINKVKVPGWPNDDGFFYTSGGAGALQNIYNLSEVVSNRPQPVGDVTDYEIQYVSTWFRTHKNPQKMPLHLTDFFVQTISCDNDQLWYDGAVTGYTNDLGGLYAPGYNGPNAIHTSDVLGASGNTPRTDYGKTLAPNIKRLDGSLNSNEELNYRMDYLHFGDMTSGNVPSGFDNVGDAWTHINNFNRGNSNYNPEENNELGFREIKYVHSSGTENFACRPSMGIERNWITDWVLVRLEWTETMADGKEHDRYGYYLGFDFSTRSGSTQIDRDGFYSNWIIKITPAYLVPGEHSARVMCEDLGGSFDFDFNDVVFDIAWDNTTHENIICLQASGGTLPIYVGKNDDERYEAHKMLGQSELVPTNVIEGGTKHEVAIYRIPEVYSSASARNDYAMPIYVEQEGVKIDINTSLPTKSDYEWIVDNQETQAGHYNKNATDKVPRKFVTGVGVKWPIELAGIDVAYKRFSDWVKKESFKYEDLNGNGDLYWYNAPGDYEKIYDYNNNQVISIDGTSTNTIKQWLELHPVGIAQNFDNQKLATEIYTIASYTGQNSLIAQLTAKGTNKQQLTFACIMKSKTEAPAGVMIPVWIHDNKAYYRSPDGTETQITESMISQASIYTDATLQPNFCQNKYASSGEGNPSTGVDALGFKTYINKFSFEATSLYYMNGGEKIWCDYIMFFCKQKYRDANSNNYNNGSTEAYSNPAKRDGDIQWYETYAIL